MDAIDRMIARVETERQHATLDSLHAVFDDLDMCEGWERSAKITEIAAEEARHIPIYDSTSSDIIPEGINLANN